MQDKCSLLGSDFKKMRDSHCRHYDLELVEPDFGAPLTDLIMELDYLRRESKSGTTHPQIFSELKYLFHLYESMCSARIEGNHTTLVDYSETKIGKKETMTPQIKELENIENAMDFVDSTVKNHPINRAFVEELHKRISHDLLPPPDGEGDRTPGRYRNSNPHINKSSHRPPDHLKVHDYMDELFAFINQPSSEKYDLLKVAIAHHRFVWIHPFTNGNGRTGRLLTYAMLLKLGFCVGRIVNPAAIFCSDREAYYKYLSGADCGSREAILAWCLYVLKGLKEEVEKINKLMNYDYLKKEILLPAIAHALESQNITEVESQILQKAIEKQVIKSADLKDIFAGKKNSEISRQIRRLLGKKMLVREHKRQRSYLIQFGKSCLLRSVLGMLDMKGFLPVK
jgi:Fic family protein